MTNKLRDHVERDIVIDAPAERVFAALTDPARWPTWGPEHIEGVIAPGETPVLDFGIAGKVAVHVVALEPPRYFAYRWAQGTSDATALLADPLERPNTLVEFFVEAGDAGTRVRVVESGISALPSVDEVNIDEALEGMGEGWRLMLAALGRAFTEGDLVVGDRIDNEIVVRGSRERVFDALVRPETWWAQSVDGAVEPGTDAVFDFGPFGRIAVHTVAAEAPSYLAYRWVQGTDDPKQRVGNPRGAYSTLVELRLEDDPEGTRIRQSESGFDDLPADDVAACFARAHRGWGVILGLLEGHLARE